MNGTLTPLPSGDPIPLIKRRIVIGRRPECDISLQFGNVSGKHCELMFKGGLWIIRDLESTNGTKVNDEKLSGPKRLQPGDEVVVARKHRFRIDFTFDEGAVLASGRDPLLNEDSEAENVFGRSLLDRAGLQEREVERFDPDDDDEPRRRAPRRD